MSKLATLIETLLYHRTRTLGLLDAIEKEPQPLATLGFRPGPGRAHIGWQLMHIAVTEEIFATERLNPQKTPAYTELWSRFRGGSTPDETIPTPDELRSVLAGSREHLLETLSHYDDGRLQEVPPPLAARNMNMLTVLQLLGWHEAHHQGQSHLTLNLWKNRPV